MTKAKKTLGSHIIMLMPEVLHLKLKAPEGQELRPTLMKLLVEVLMRQCILV